MELRAKVIGVGPPLLCLSGFGCGRWLFEPLVEGLKGHYTLVLPDNRGMGHSPGTLEPYAMEDLARDALALMNRLGISTFHLAGISMGGFIAQALMTLEPDRVKGLVLLGTTSGGPLFDAHYVFWSEENMMAVLDLDAEAYARWIIEPPASPCLQRYYPEAYQFFLDKRHAHPEAKEQVLLQFRAMQGFLARSWPLETFSSPTLVVCGEYDPVFPPPNAQLLAQRMPNAILRQMDHTDHLFFAEKAQETAQVIRRFLESLDRSKG